MTVEVPYVLFRTRSGVYGIDGYFYPALERVEHRAALLRKMEPKPLRGVSGKYYVTPDNVKDILRELALELYELAGRSFDERNKHMRRWNILRFLGIPSGYLKNLRRDNELAGRVRRVLLALSIVEHVLGIKGPADLENLSIEPLGWTLFRLEVVDGKPVDPVYAQLYEDDAGFRRALFELLQKEKGLEKERL
ncbi:hypothetical protein X802_08260 [Thermococcus guaymasensis DSM 11113]|uniref:Uncharacterized protein n=1 Tax=Thermococcus guaymasensis DSM 11113 TaxID=1432656 RepID=A0A0X1KLL9_9EURY|nr:hypothetical protein [Thermococcus guaymasensis]AJC72154.1 hypothetical protein X802_08260 [Thermococcus guaymasensis DSM 11113]